MPLPLTMPTVTYQVYDAQLHGISEVDWQNEAVKLTNDNSVLVRFSKKQSNIYYMGKVKSSDNFDVSVWFLRKKHEFELLLSSS